MAYELDSDNGARIRNSSRKAPPTNRMSSKEEEEEEYLKSQWVDFHPPPAGSILRLRRPRWYPYPLCEVVAGGF
ncbi:hypothetical protein CRG98_004893 [Punica granatum]|uniref:Uncharacterized protein n=1 Tax=Punica granatum TaxID=22663 RepID=A0A2I0L346_PUNGR|nr:hypothetical protein CRG98_004893 [Punica granatum]